MPTDYERSEAEAAMHPACEVCGNRCCVAACFACDVPAGVRLPTGETLCADACCAAWAAEENGEKEAA